VSNKIILRSLILIIFGSLFFLPGCNYPNPNPPTIGCSVLELINAIVNANLTKAHDHIILPDSCHLELGETLFEVPDPDESTDYGFAGLPLITSPITITGNGSRIFRAIAPHEPEYRIFYVGPDAILALVDLVLESGYVSGPGGAILIEEGTLTLTQCTLQDNRSEYRNGGAVGSINGQVVVTDSLFRENSAVSGGAISTLYGTVDIDFDTLLEENQASGHGGAIHNDMGELTIYNSTIRDNTAEMWGGGIYIHYGTLSLTRVLLEGNQAVAAGGGVYSQGGILTISDTNIHQNQADAGGGIFLAWSDAVISQGTQIEGNIANEIGGGINLDLSSNLTLESSTIADNQAGTDGGGIGQGPNPSGPVASMSDCTVSGNTASDQGGGVFINSADWTILTSTISGNSADEGAGIYNQGSLMVESSTISSNQARRGAGIYNLGSVTVQNSTISSNQAQRGGGFLHDSPSVANLSFVTVTENSANNGAGLLADSTYIQITNSIVAGNDTENCQGAITAFEGNLDDDGSCGFEINDNPLLETLGDNGGTTHTHAIPSFSPAAEVADPCTPLNSTTPLDVDQRGETRPQGAACDLGAYEAGISALPLPPLPTFTPAVYPGNCIYEVLKNSNCRESDYLSAPVVAILMKGEITELIALNPENSFGKFKIPSGQACWVSLGLMLAIDPLVDCPAPEEDPPEAEIPPEPKDQPESKEPHPQVCHSKLSKDACEESGGKWVEGPTEAPHCVCP
jgi:parallel beta-helix repeat protein